MSRSTQDPRTSRLVGLAAAAALLLALGACGGSEDEAPEDSAESSSASADPGLADPGEDLLAGVRRGVELTGVESRVTWKLPDSYESTGTQQARLEDGGVTYELSVGAKPGTTRQAEGEAFLDEATEGVETTAEEVTVGGEPFTLVTLDSPETSLRAFFYTPEDRKESYAVLFRSGASLDETPPERLEELYQMVGSLELEPKEGFGS